MRGSRYLQADAKPGEHQDFARDAMLKFTKGAFRCYLVPRLPLQESTGAIAYYKAPTPATAFPVPRSPKRYISHIPMSDITI